MRLSDNLTRYALPTWGRILKKPINLWKAHKEACSVNLHICVYVYVCVCVYLSISKVNTVGF